MSDQDRYLWDPTAPPDPELQRLETLLRADPYPPLDPEQVRRMVRRQLRTVRLRQAPPAAVLVDLVFGGNRLRLRWTGVALVLFAALGAAVLGWATRSSLQGPSQLSGEVQRAGVPTTALVPRNNLLLMLDPTGQGAASMARPAGTPQPATLEVLFIPQTAGTATISTAQVDLRLQSAWLSLPTAERGVALVEGQASGLRLSGVALVEPGVNLVSLGGPGSRSAFDYNQLRSLYDGALQVLSAANLPSGAPIVTAGIGADTAAILALRLGRGSVTFSEFVNPIPSAAIPATHSAPAVAVAFLAESG